MIDSLSLDTNVITTKIKQYRFNKFLIEHLNPLKQRTIITYEPCVVSSVKYKKQFKFIVIERDGVCLTENAPSNYHKVVEFADILDVILVPDQPDFLKGKDHDDSQHIALKYLSNQKLTKEIQTELKKFFKEKNKISKKEKPKKDFETIGKLFKPSAEVIGKITVGELAVKAMQDIAKKNPPKMDEDKKSSSKNKKESKEKTDPTNAELIAQKKGHSIPAVPLFYDKLIFTEKNIKQDDIEKKKYIILPLSSKPSTKTNTEALSLGIKYEKDELEASLSTSAILKIGLKKINPPMVEQLESNFKNMNLILNARDSVMKDMEDDAKLKENERLERTTIEFINDNGKNFEKSEKSYMVEEVLDIYLLNRYSMLYFYLRQAWINFKIVQAEGRDRDEDIYCHYSTQEELKSRFKTLKHNLVDLTKMKLNLVNVNKVLRDIKQELELGGSQSKKHFWKDNILFTKLLDFIEMFKDVLFLTSFENSELLLRVHLDFIRILVLSLSETEAYEDRILHVVNDGGGHLIKLVEYVIFLNLSGFEEINEYLNFVVDHTTCSINLFYELLLLCVQAPFCLTDDDKSTVNIQWLVAKAENNENFLHFFDRLMSIMMSCFMKDNTTGDEINEMQIKNNGPILVLLYKCFFILDKFQGCGSKLNGWLKENYSLDFRYVLDIGTIMETLPKNYTLTFDLIRMIDDVIKRVL